MRFINELIQRYPILESVREDIIKSFEIIKDAYLTNNKLLVGGNGGSAADSEHIVGELMKGFINKRSLDESLQNSLIDIDKEKGEYLAKSLQKSLKAIAITSHNSLTTAFANDVDPTLGFAQQVNGYGEAEDVLLCLSTSGNAKNLVYAAITAKAKGMKVITLSGKNGGALRKYSDVSVIVPETETYKIQELHLPIYHALCLELENYFFN